MADKGFAIEGDLPTGVTLNTPLYFLEEKKYFLQKKNWKQGKLLRCEYTLKEPSQELRLFEFSVVLSLSVWHQILLKYG